MPKRTPMTKAEKRVRSLYRNWESKQTEETYASYQAANAAFEQTQDGIDALYRQGDAAVKERKYDLALKRYSRARLLQATVTPIHHDDEEGKA